MKPCSAPVLAMMLAAAVAGCTDSAISPDPAPQAEAATKPAPPVPVNGWAEFPLREGVIRIQPQPWRTDRIQIPVSAGEDLEYKLTMKAGDALIYSIDYGDLDHPGLMVSEFHGHTEKRADGIGDLMFYSKVGPPSQHGQFTAPWDGIHGWYLKNESTRDVTVTLNAAGYYELEAN